MILPCRICGKEPEQEWYYKDTYFIGCTEWHPGETQDDKWATASTVKEAVKIWNEKQKGQLTIF